MTYQPDIVPFCDVVSGYLGIGGNAMPNAKPRVIRTYDDFTDLLVTIVADPWVGLLIHDRPRADLQELLAATALCALNPGVGAPPERLWAALCHHVHAILDAIAHGATDRGGGIEFPMTRALIAGAHAPDTPLQDLVFDLAIAVGCGKWRDPGISGAWDQIWPGAVSALTAILQGVMIEPLRGLSRAVAGFEDLSTPARLNAFAQGEAARVASALLSRPTPLQSSQVNVISVTFDGQAVFFRVGGEEWFVPNGLPPGARLVIGDCEEVVVTRGPEGRPVDYAGAKKVVTLSRDDGAHVYFYEVAEAQRQIGLIKLGINDPISISLKSGKLLPCGCGRFVCPDQHQFLGWDLERFSLRSCAAVAVKGPDKSLKPGSFVQGLYADILSKYGWERSWHA